MALNSVARHRRRQGSRGRGKRFSILRDLIAAPVHPPCSALTALRDLTTERNFTAFLDASATMLAEVPWKARASLLHVVLHVTSP